MQPREAVLATPELLSLVFAFLPPDSRLLCREVSTLWRRLLRDPERCWTVLDFSDTVREVDEPLLEAAAAAAAGRIHTLVSPASRKLWDDEFNPTSALGPVLLRVLRDNAASLRRVRSYRYGDESGNAWYYGDLVNAQVAGILEAAPALELLETRLCGFDTASSLLILRDERVRLDAFMLCLEEVLDRPQVHELLTAIARQRRTLRSIATQSVPVHLAADAFVAVLCDCPHLTRCEIGHTTISSDTLAALGRLLGAGLLLDLDLEECEAAPDLWTSRTAALAFAAGLRANRRITDLSFGFTDIFGRRGSVGAEATVLSSMVAHPSLKFVRVSDQGDFPRTVPGFVTTWLSAVVTANSPLGHIHADLHLSEEDVLPFYSALGSNTRLHSITAPGRNMSAGFLREVVLPAVTANTSLETIWVPEDLALTSNRLTRHQFIEWITALVNARS